MDDNFNGSLVESDDHDDIRQLSNTGRRLILGFLAKHAVDYDSGDGYALLHLIELCMAHNIKVPDEYSGAFSKALRNFESHDSRTLDDALNIKGPMKTGKHQDAAKKEYAMASEVHCAIVEQRNQKVARDDGLFELVGEQFGIGKTTAKKYYYLEEKRMERLRGFLKAILIDDSYP